MQSFSMPPREWINTRLWWTPNIICIVQIMCHTLTVSSRASNSPASHALRTRDSMTCTASSGHQWCCAFLLWWRRWRRWLWQRRKSTFLTFSRLRSDVWLIDRFVCPFLGPLFDCHHHKNCFPFHSVPNKHTRRSSRNSDSTNETSAIFFDFYFQSKHAFARVSNRDEHKSSGHGRCKNDKKRKSYELNGHCEQFLSHFSFMHNQQQKWRTKIYDVWTHSNGNWWCHQNYSPKNEEGDKKKKKLRQQTTNGFSALSTERQNSRWTWKSCRFLLANICIHSLTSLAFLRFVHSMFPKQANGFLHFRFLSETVLAVAIVDIFMNKMYRRWAQWERTISISCRHRIQQSKKGKMRKSDTSILFNDR